MDPLGILWTILAIIGGAILAWTYTDSFKRWNNS